jgi:D-galactarolactone cycloisomerase
MPSLALKPPSENKVMKIRTITSHLLRVPLGDKTFYSSQAAFPERNSYLVRIETDSGLVGWGEGGQYGPAEPVAACVDAVLAPRLIGRDPTEPVRIWEELYAYSRDFGQRGTYIEALSAIDIALWDIAGQALGIPVWKLLGGRFRDRITAYATGCYYPEDFSNMPALLKALEAEAAGYAGSGFELLKIKIGLLAPQQDIERLRTIRNAIGPDVGLLVDANHGYNAAAAIRMGRLMEPYNVCFFEEPVPPEDRDGYRKVRAENPIPVAGGECEFTRYGFRDFIAGGCVDIVQPDLAVTGGFTAFTHILAFANAYGIATVPHVWGSGIAVAAALQAIAAIAPFPFTANPIPLLNQPVIEFDRKHNPLRDDLLEERFELVDGCLAVPDRPGLGVTVREEILAKYSY